MTESSTVAVAAKAHHFHFAVSEGKALISSL